MDQFSLLSSSLCIFLAYWEFIITYKAYINALFWSIFAEYVFSIKISQYLMSLFLIIFYA